MAVYRRQYTCLSFIVWTLEIWLSRLLLLPIIDLLQQFEDYVKGIVLRKRKKEKKKKVQ